MALLELADDLSCMFVELGVILDQFDIFLVLRKPLSRPMQPFTQRADAVLATGGGGS
jgi:hypothetical protein